MRVICVASEKLNHLIRLYVYEHRVENKSFRLPFVLCQKLKNVSAQDKKRMMRLKSTVMKFLLLSLWLFASLVLSLLLFQQHILNART